ncbi:MAG: hypothetical protein ACI8UO_000392 [Verrucomicrobiales bacterium]
MGSISAKSERFQEAWKIEQLLVKQVIGIGIKTGVKPVDSCGEIRRMPPPNDRAESGWSRDF